MGAIRSRTVTRGGDTRLPGGRDGVLAGHAVHLGSDQVEIGVAEGRDGSVGEGARVVECQVVGEAGDRPEAVRRRSGGHQLHLTPDDVVNRPGYYAPFE